VNAKKIPLFNYLYLIIFLLQSTLSVKKTDGLSVFLPDVVKLSFVLF